MEVPSFDCGPSCFIMELAEVYVKVTSSSFGLASVILGGLVLWSGLVLARFILNGFSFRNRRGRR